MSGYEGEYEEERPQGGFWGNLATFGSWAFTGLAALLVAAFLLAAEAQRPGPVARAGEETLVVIPPGHGVNAIGRRLEAAGAIRSAIFFRAATLVYGGGRPLQAGEYAIPSRANLRSVIEQLGEGRAVLHAVTVPEGWTSAMVVDLLAGADFLAGDTPPAPPEGSLLPETYKVSRGADRAELLADMRRAHARTVAELWEGRAADLPFDTPEEAVILASIVEKETGIAEERPRVASVFVNRLRRGMRLESDPTIIYGVTQGRPLGRGILKSELDRATPYNTYKINGLPPTPIANPGREAIAAVLNPPQTKDLFFVADGSGGHVFAATYPDHLRNVQRWRQVEKSRAAQR